MTFLRRKLRQLASQGRAGKAGRREPLQSALRRALRRSLHGERLPIVGAGGCSLQPARGLSGGLSSARSPALTRAGRPRGGSRSRRAQAPRQGKGRRPAPASRPAPVCDGGRGARLSAHKPKRPFPRHKYFTKGPEGVHGTQVTSAEGEENEDLFPVTGQLEGNAAGPASARDVGRSTPPPRL